MGKKLKDFGNALFTGFTETILGFFSAIKALASNPRSLVLFLVLCSFSYDFATGDGGALAATVPANCVLQ